MRPALIPLMKARALIADPAKWGRGIRSDRPVFESYCAAEAIEACAPILAVRKEAYRLFQKGAGNPETLTDWNDSTDRTHAEVLAAFDKAIEAAQ